MEPWPFRPGDFKLPPFGLGPFAKYFYVAAVSFQRSRSKIRPPSPLLLRRSAPKDPHTIPSMMHERRSPTGHPMIRRLELFLVQSLASRAEVAVIYFGRRTASQGTGLQGFVGCQ